MSERQIIWGSGAWLRATSDKELFEVLSDERPGPFQAAISAELERRESEREAATQRRWIKRTFWAAVALGLGGILATLATCASPG